MATLYILLKMIDMNMTNWLINLLRCPSDSATLSAEGDSGFRCLVCNKLYRKIAEQFWDIRPDHPSTTPRRLMDGYKSIFFEEVYLGENTNTRAWGTLANAHPGYRAFIKAERDFIISQMEGRRGTLVDVSGGVGNYSIYLADYVDKVIHCELHAPSICKAFQSNTGKQNIAFLRSDYMALPLRDDSADIVICTDTLERGAEHEKSLLMEIKRIMKPAGIALVDFHNLRFDMIIRKSKDVIFYELKDLMAILNSVKFDIEKITPLGYVPSKIVPNEMLYRPFDYCFSAVVKPSRYLLMLKK